MKLIVDKISYSLGETLELRIIPEDSVPGSGPITNISVDIIRLDPDRNRTAFGFGRRPDQNGNEFILKQPIPANLRPGLHCISHVLASRDVDLENGTHHPIRISPVFFFIRTAIELPLTPERLRQLIETANESRRDYARTPIKTDTVGSSNPPAHFRVIIFATGCLVDGAHQMAGYKIVPLGQGMSHRHMLDVVNEGLTKEGIERLPFIEATEQNFSSNTPTFMVDYDNVLAVDHEDAFSHCHEHAAFIFRALCMERGDMPERFASFALQYDTSNRWHEFKPPWYRGNRIGGLNMSTTADAVERMLPKIQSDPFLRLLVATFTDGMK